MADFVDVSGFANGYLEPIPDRSTPVGALVANPLAAFPDLDPCLCGSGHIWRRCHKSQMLEMIPKDEAVKIEEFLERRKKVEK